MISPLKDIVIATVLGTGAGLIWNNFKDGELDRIGRFYKCRMRLYVHLEPADAALAWTKRLTLPSADALHASPSVRSVLNSFIGAYNAKFRPQTPLGAQTVDVYVEFHQNVASRRLLSSLDASIAAVASSRGSTTVHAGKDGQDTKLGRTLALAEIHMKQKKFRAARDIYTHVLAEDPRNPKALLALGGILVACGRHEEAAKKYFLKYWKTHGERDICTGG
uniref:Uncharacterized protein n=1 Tax=Phytophthora ramorum TaxID=164328 RepID=H3HC96_PHYRM